MLYWQRWNHCFFGTVFLKISKTYKAPPPLLYNTRNNQEIFSLSLVPNFVNIQHHFLLMFNTSCAANSSECCTNTSVDTCSRPVAPDGPVRFLNRAISSGVLLCSISSLHFFSVRFQELFPHKGLSSHHTRCCAQTSASTWPGDLSPQATPRLHRNPPEQQCGGACGQSVSSYF